MSLRKAKHPMGYKVGTRGSALALKQTEMIIGRLQAAHPRETFEVAEITTHGDRFGDTPITAMGDHIDRGIFNSGLEEALLEKQVDFVTCSFKDVESDLPGGIIAVPVFEREDPRDVMLSRHGGTLADLPQGSLLATSSPRRISQLLAFREDFRFHPLRGNLTTRAGEAVEKYDGVIVAAAGMIRMGFQERITEWIAPETLLPAAAQAAMGCEYLSTREDVAALIQPLRHEETELCVSAEKKLLVTLSGGCFAPIGSLATITQGRFNLQTRIVSLDGKTKAEGQVEGDPARIDALIETLAKRLSDQGGREIIAKTREDLQSAK